ncbi:MAG: hypothetical protein IJ308_03625 [Clostridia bacterium]|nr:hypothetical protein [Clostridia bacterium]
MISPKKDGTGECSPSWCGYLGRAERTHTFVSQRRRRKCTKGHKHESNERTFFGDTQTRVHGRRYTDARACRGTMGRLGSCDWGRAVAPKNAMSVGCVIIKPRRAELLSTEEAVYPPMRWRIFRKKTKMKRAIKIENLKPLCDTDSQVLRVIALKLGEDKAKYIDYGLIADSIGKTRDAVRKSVNRMLKRRILTKKDGKLAIENAVLVQ